MTERDPHGTDPHAPGAKLDDGKPPVRQGVMEYFPRALIEIAKVSEYGARKYSWGGWGPVPDGITRYGNAMDRHALLAQIEGPIDRDSGLLHAAHEAWNAIARLELMLRQPAAGKSSTSFACLRDLPGPESPAPDIAEYERLAAIVELQVAVPTPEEEEAWEKMQAAMKRRGITPISRSNRCE